MNKKLLFLFALLCASGVPLRAQTSLTGRWIPGLAAARPTCSSVFNATTANSGDVYDDIDDAGVFKCIGGSWGSFSGGGGGAVYPPSGIPQSNGSSWLTSLQIGTAAGNLVQVQAGGALPALSANALTGFPIFNQNTTGSAGSLLNCLTVTAGSLCMWNGSQWAVFAGNSSGTQFLSENASGVPSWSAGGGALPTETQFCLPYYATASSFGCLPSPTVDGLYTMGWAPTTGAAIAPAVIQFGVNSIAITGSQTSLTGGINYSLVGWKVEHDKACSAPVNQNLPTATTLANPNFSFTYANHCVGQTDTITPVTWTINGNSTLSIAANVACNIYVDSNSSTNWLADCTSGYTLPTQYTKNSCQGGLGDGLNAIPAGTYLQTFCLNDSGVTRTITGVKCFTDNNGTTSLNASGNTLGALLTGAVSCTTSYVAGTQSANVLLTNGDYIKFTFVADGTTKQLSYVVTSTE